MVKNNPVKIWIIRHKANNDPKFHQDEILEGEGRSIKELLIIFKTGWVLRIGL